MALRITEERLVFRPHCCFLLGTLHIWGMCNYMYFLIYIYVFFWNTIYIHMHIWLVGLFVFIHQSIHTHVYFYLYIYNIYIYTYIYADMGLIGEATDHGNILPKIWMSKETWPRFLVHPESTKRLFWDCLACVPAANHWIRLPLKHHTQNKNKRTIRLYLEMVYAQWWQFIREDDINRWVWGASKMVISGMMLFTYTVVVPLEVFHFEVDSAVMSTMWLAENMENDGFEWAELLGYSSPE